MMQLLSKNFSDGGTIPGHCAFGVADARNHVALSANRNPHLAWSGAPDDTRSFVVVCIDVDVPTRGDDVNQEGRTVPADLPRTEFVHWLLVDLPSSVTELGEGACADGVVPHGKQNPPGPVGSRSGVNDYSSWFADDPDMAGRYLGYDGPCPPWNDSLVHHYHFTIYAVDVARLDVPAGFGLAELRLALEGHVLDQASLVGRYSLNPAVPA